VLSEKRGKKYLFLHQYVKIYMNLFSPTENELLVVIFQILGKLLRKPRANCFLGHSTSAKNSHSPIPPPCTTLTLSGGTCSNCYEDKGKFNHTAFTKQN
jgi:hypothetical protein